MTKTYWHGKVISSEFARMLEDTGQAHVGAGSGGGTAPDGTTGEAWIRMDPGPGNKYLETQPPDMFLLHVFGHTCTWREMAARWGEDDEGMAAVAEKLKDLNREILKYQAEHRNML